MGSGFPASGRRLSECQSFDHKNSKSYSSQWQGSDTDSWDGCCAQCVDDCSGWTYVYNGAQGAKGQCWLKTGVGDPSSWEDDPNVISGLATGTPPSPTPPAPGNCQAFDHKNSKSYASQRQGSDTDSWDGCCAQCVDTVLAGLTCIMVLLELRGSAGSRPAWVIPAAGTTTRT